MVLFSVAVILLPSRLVLLIYSPAFVLVASCLYFFCLVCPLVMEKICSGEYDKVTCIFLGVATELSMIALDLTMVILSVLIIGGTFLFFLWITVLLILTLVLLDSGHCTRAQSIFWCELMHLCPCDCF